MTTKTINFRPDQMEAIEALVTNHRCFAYVVRDAVDLGIKELRTAHATK